jgi:hypothetical protein
MQTAWVFGDAADILDRVPRPDVSGYLVYLYMGEVFMGMIRMLRG